MSESKPKYRIEQSGDCVAVVCGDRSFAGTKLEMAQHLGQAWEEVRRLREACETFLRVWGHAGPNGSAQWEKFDVVLNAIENALGDKT